MCKYLLSQIQLYPTLLDWYFSWGLANIWIDAFFLTLCNDYADLLSACHSEERQPLHLNRWFWDSILFSCWSNGLTSEYIGYSFDLYDYSVEIRFSWWIPWPSSYPWIMTWPIDCMHASNDLGLPPTNFAAQSSPSINSSSTNWGHNLIKYQLSKKT